MLPEKLENALHNPKTTSQGVVALVAAVALAVFTLSNEGVNAESLSQGAGAVALMVAAVQRIFFSKDKPTEEKK